LINVTIVQVTAEQVFRTRIRLKAIGSEERYSGGRERFRLDIFLAFITRFIIVELPDRLLADLIFLLDAFIYIQFFTG